MIPTKITNPNFIIGKPLPVTGTWRDDRIFIYCVQHLSLIEVWPSDHGTVAFPKEQYQKVYAHEDEEYLLVFTQNNIRMIEDVDEMVHGDPSKKVIEAAWKAFKSFLATTSF